MIKKLVTAAIFAAVTTVSATPWLQLDIVGGQWVGDGQDVLLQNPEGPFTLYALFNVSNPNTSAQRIEEFLSDEYYLSIAALPTYSSEVANLDLGYITVDGVDYNLNNNDMFYGNPPAMDIDGGEWDSGDLQPHGIFPTYYTEIGFNFSTDNVQAYDVKEDVAGIGPDFSTDGTMYYKAFTVDISNLNTEGLHFDVYNKKYLNNGDVDVPKNAPFSHDATVLVPEPGLLSLFGFGLLGFAGLLRRRKK